MECYKSVGPVALIMHQCYSRRTEVLVQLSIYSFPIDTSMARFVTLGLVNHRQISWRCSRFCRSGQGGAGHCSEEKKGLKPSNSGTTPSLTPPTRETFPASEVASEAPFLMPRSSLPRCVARLLTMWSRRCTYSEQCSAGSVVPGVRHPGKPQAQSVIIPTAVCAEIPQRGSGYGTRRVTPPPRVHLLLQVLLSPDHEGARAAAATAGCSRGGAAGALMARPQEEPVTL